MCVTLTATGFGVALQLFQKSSKWSRSYFHAILAAIVVTIMTVKVKFMSDFYIRACTTNYKRKTERLIAKYGI